MREAIVVTTGLLLFVGLAFGGMAVSAHLVNRGGPDECRAFCAPRLVHSHRESGFGDRACTCESPTPGYDLGSGEP